MSLIGLASLSFLIGLSLLGAFSRLTHGRHTPAFYAYQVARAPDDGSRTARLIPCVDLTMAALLAWRPSRAAAALLGALFQFCGVISRVRQDENAAPDLAGTLIALLLCWDCLLGNQ